MKPSLIIFDLDGVLIDSEIVWHQVNARYLSQLGYPLTAEESMRLFSGHNELAFDEVFSQKFGAVLPDDDKAAINYQTELDYPELLEPMPAIKKVLGFLKHKAIPFCVASNADHKYIEMVLDMTNLDHYFKPSHLFGTDSLTKRKPIKSQLLV